MMSRGFTTSALASTLLLAVALVLFLSAFRESSHEPLVSHSPAFHFTATRGSLSPPDARLAFFDSPMGPYSGSLVFLDFIDEGVQVDAFGDSMGVYYRRIRWPSGECNWTLMVSLWYPIIVFSILPGIWILQYARARSGSDRTGGAQPGLAPCG
jgi:hypothetical protein